MLRYIIFTIIYLLELEILLEKISSVSSAAFNGVKVRYHQTMPPIPDILSGCLGNTLALNHTSFLCHFHTKTGGIRPFETRGNVNIVFGSKKDGLIHIGITYCFPEISRSSRPSRGSLIFGYPG